MSKSILDSCYLATCFVQIVLLMVAVAENSSPTLKSSRETKKLKVDSLKTVSIVKISDKAFIEINQRWKEQAYVSIFASLAAKKLEGLPSKVKDEFVRCSKEVKTVVQHAKCLSKMLRTCEKLANFTVTARTQSVDYFKQIEPQKGARTAEKAMEISRKSKAVLPTAKKAPLTSKFGSSKRYQIYQQPSKERRIKRKKYVKMHLEKVNAPYQRRRRQIQSVGKISAVRRNSYQLFNKYQGIGALGLVARLLTSGTTLLNNSSKQHQKNSTYHRIPWQATVEKIRQMAKKQNLGQQLFDEPAALKEISSSVDKGMQISGKLVPTKIRNLLQSGVKLGMSLAGRNTSGDDRKPITLLSPRFLSLFPDEEEDDSKSVSVLSPSVLSMHDQGKGLEKNTSLPTILKDFSHIDRQQWMNFIMEAAGINDRANNMLSEVNGIDYVTGIEEDSSLMNTTKTNKAGHELVIDGKIVAQFNDSNIQQMSVEESKIHTEYIDADLERRKLRVWDLLTSSYSLKQLRELNETGTTLLTPAQQKLIYGSKSPYKDLEALARFNSLTPEQLARAIEEDVHRMAEMDSIQFPLPALRRGVKRRVKRQVVNLILSPAVLVARVSSPLLAGPVVLSPRLLTPIINSAIGFGAVILSPGAFVPLILAPYMTRPQVLSPGVFNPAVLSPLMFSPSILSPQVFSPTILTPFLFVPLILNPILGSPLILSPRLLSPVIFSYRLLYALILSPYALTPSIYSPKPDEIRVLSPSWLS